MKKPALPVFLFSLFFFFLSAGRAYEFSNNFRFHLNESSLDALTEDLGAVLGGASFHQGKALGFPLGLDVGVHVPVVGVHEDNKVLEVEGSTARALWGQAELGLPRHLNLIGRVGKMYDADMAGGGLRLGLLNPSLPGLPALSVSVLYNRMDHDYFEVQNVSANLALSMDFPFLHPYVGAGYDWSELVPTDRAFEGVSPLVSRNIKGEASGYRLEAGVNVSVIPFTYITGAVGLANGREMFHVGAGVQF